MILRKNVNFNTPSNGDQKEIPNRTEVKPAEFDNGYHQLTLEELQEFKMVSDIRKEERRKQTVTIRLSPQALSKAKSLGKGYTSVLSRILEMALNDNEMIKKCL